MNNEISKSRTFQSVTASLAAAIIPDTPIVSIAGATLSEITTTTTSTTTTPTPTPTSFEPTKAPSTQTPINLGFTKDPMSNIPNDDAKDNISQNEHQLKQQLQEEEVKAEESVAAADMNNDSKTVIQINTTHKTCVTINSDDHKYCVDDDECAAKNENNNNNTNNAHGYKSQPNDMQNASLAPFVEGSNYKTLCAINSNGKLDTQTVAISIENETVATSGKNDEIKTNTKCKSLKQIENNNSNGNNKVDISDLGDKDLKNLLDEAYFYKPSDLENRSLVFQQLLKETEEEKEEKTRALKSGKLMQQLMKESGHIKEERIVKPGSLQNFVSEFRNEERKLHNCDFKSSKSVTVDSDGVMSVVVYPKTYMGACYRPTPQIVPRKNKLPTKNTDNSKSIEEEEDNLSKMPEKSDTSAKTTNAAVSGVNLKGRSGDFIIDMSDTMLDIQQKQQILQSKGQDPTTQGLPFYERMDSMELRIPRPNMKNAINLESKCSDGTNHCYVDDKVHFSSIERSGNYSAGLDTKYMPLDDNYKSYKSCLGEKGTTGAGAGTNMSLSKNTQHQYDENDNPVQKSYVVNYKLSSESSGAILSGTSGLSNSSSSNNNNNNNSNITISSANSIGIPQTKTKSKKKSQQERNTKTVNVTSVAGYRGNDPVDDLVKYIENIDDKQTSSSKGGGNNTDNKKRERKKEKQQQQHKLKKSNSLEELISTSKIAMDESDTAATTESHVLMRHKGKNGNQRNTSASNVDINKHCEGGTHKEKIQQLTMPKSAAITDTVNKTNERRSWGTDELHYFGDGNGAGTTTVAATDEKNKERKGKKDKEKHVEEEMEIDTDMDNKDEVPEIVNPILNNAGSPTKDINSIAAQQLQSYNNSIINSNKNSNANKKEDKEKLDKVEKRKKCDNNNSNNLQSQEITPSNVEHVTLVSETAEFHVVTKKKKPKKKNSSNENLITNNNNNNTTTNNINNNNYNNNNSNINNNNNNNSTSFTSVATTITTTTTGTTTSPITTHNSIGVTMKNNNNNNKQNKNKNINNNNNNNINNNNSNINNLPPTNKMICNNLHKNTNLINANQTRYQQRTHDGNTTITSSNNTSNTCNDEDVNDEQNGQQQPQQQFPDNKKNIDKNVINNKQQTKNSQTTQQQHEIENDIVENADIQQPQSYQKNMQNKHNKQQQQQHQQFAHKNHTDNKDGKKQNNNKDKKSRRKSTSSMPVSDLSDSSDLDSVHSLPTNNNINNKQAANVAKNKQQQQQHQQRLSQTAHTATNVNSLTTTSTSTNIPKAQISYADIARTHKTPTTTATTQQQQQVSNDKLNIIDSNNILSESNGEGVITTTATTSANNQIKAKTNKKTVHKIDFPELVAINSTNNNSPPQQQQQQQQSDGTTNVVSYSKRLTANQGLTEVVDGNVDDVVEINHDVNNKLEQTTISSNHNSNNNVRITKAKSVEHEIIYNDMDQQYPSLEMSVKRHSSAHIGHHQLPQQHQLQSATQINFAAAAKQNVATTRLLNKTNTTESVMMALNDNNDVQMSRKTNRKEKPATTDMQKSPAQTQSEVDNNNKNSRPAVIILNDERNKSVDSEFTFGDFDEEELKFFDEEMLEEQGQQNEHDEEHDVNNMESHSMPQLTRLEYVARVKCCHCYPVRPQQLETCNDIETVIIAAARAAAAEKERDQHKLQDESMLSYDDEYEKSNMIEYSSFASVVSSHKHQHQIQNQQQQQYQSHEQHIPDCEMMRQGNKRLKAGNDALSEPIAINIGDTDIDIYYQPPKNSNNGNSSSNNNEHIVEFISNAWREILSSNSAVIYDEQ